MVLLKSTEINGYLSANRPYGKRFIEVFLRKYNGEYAEEQNSVDNLWIIENY